MATSTNFYQFMKFLLFTFGILTNVLRTEGNLWEELKLTEGVGPCSSVPQNFPSGITIRKTSFKNWNEEIVSKNLWVVIPFSISDVIAVTNWAFVNDYKIRAKGSGFSWSPMTVLPNADCSKFILMDFTKHFRSMSVEKSDNSAVRVQTGASMNSLLEFLENIDRGLGNTAVVGDITVGGTFGLANHGFGAPASGEVLSPGLTYGSLSNTIISLTAIVWDESLKEYVAKEFFPKDPETKAFLTHLGRALVIDYVIRVGRNYNLRCISRTDKKDLDLFNLPGNSGGNTYAHYLNTVGRVQTISFPLSTSRKNTFLRFCSVEEAKPEESLEVIRPYNYPYLDNIPAPASNLIQTFSIISKQKLTPAVQTAGILTISTGISLTKTGDLWGLSKNHLLFIKSTSLRITTSGYAVITSANNVQYVIQDFASFYLSLLKSYAEEDEYPMSGPYEIRVTGLDRPEDVLVPGAESPTLSPSTPFPSKPHFNTAVWIDLTTTPGAPNLFEFMEKVESFLFSRFNGGDALVRPEWSKRFAFTKEGPFTNLTVLKTIIPQAYENQNQGWHWTNSIFKSCDPHSVFTNEFLEQLFN